MKIFSIFFYILLRFFGGIQNIKNRRKRTLDVCLNVCNYVFLYISLNRLKAAVGAGLDVFITIISYTCIQQHLGGQNLLWTYIWPMPPPETRCGRVFERHTPLKHNTGKALNVCERSNAGQQQVCEFLKTFGLCGRKYLVKTK